MAEILHPRTLDEATAMLLERPDARALGGGTAIQILRREGLIDPPTLVDLDGLSELRGIRSEDGFLCIGAMVTQREVELSETVRAAAPLLAQTYRHVANVRVRYTATVGGNLAHGDYRLDPPAPLIALRASVRIAGPSGQREVPLEQFFYGLYATALEPGEILTEVVVPDPPPRTHAAYLKYTSLSAMDWPCLGVAAAVTLAEDGTCDDLRVVLTSVSSTPVLVQGAAELARGQRLTGALLEEVGARAAEQVEPTPDIRGSEWYKREMARVFAGRAIRAAAARGGVMSIE